VFNISLNVFAFKSVVLIEIENMITILNILY
jgi:hypothetical protein